MDTVHLLLIYLLFKLGKLVDSQSDSTQCTNFEAANDRYCESDSYDADFFAIAYSSCSDYCDAWDKEIWGCVDASGSCTEDNGRIRCVCCHCSDNTPTIMSSYHIAYTVACCLLFFVSILITKKIYSNLFECTNDYSICNYCYKIEELDKYIWIIEPSKSNKWYALIASLLYTLYFLSNSILYGISIAYYNISMYSIILVSSSLLDAAGITAYYLYLKTTLQYHMENEQISNMIPGRIIQLMKFLTFFNLAQKIGWVFGNVIALYGWGMMLSDPFFNDDMNYDQYGYAKWFFISDKFINLFMKIAVIYLYYVGFNNVCHYWYSKQWEEFDKYGENERTHETIIKQARFCCIMIISVTVSFIEVLLQTIYFVYTICTWNNYQILKHIADIGYFVEIIIAMLSIYFIYEFSHMDYEKYCCCNKCDSKLQEYFKNRFQNQVENNNISDGAVYKENACNNSCCNKCCPCFSIERNNTGIQILMSDNVDNADIPDNDFL